MRSAFGRLALAALCAAGPATVAAAQEAEGVLLRGTLDGKRDRVDLAGATVSVNGVPAELGADGSYAVRLPPGNYYQLIVDGPGLFRTVQTFGGAELRDAACHCLLVPPIDPVARRAGRVELFFGGDTMAGRRYFTATPNRPALIEPATIGRDLALLLEPMQPYFAGSDVSSVNLETVLADSAVGPSPPKRIVFYSPTELAGALHAAGIDHANLGNNHTYDYLDLGLEHTRSALDRVGLVHAGAGPDLATAETPGRFDLGESRISMLGYLGWAGRFDPNMVAGSTKGGALLGQMRSMAAAIRRERRAGRVPIVQMHTGTEYADEPTEPGVRRMRHAIDNGAPLVASHHPHVTQGLERYNGGLIAYSLGNFLFEQNFVETMAGFVLKAWLDDGRLIRAEVIPIQMLDYRPVPAVGTMRETALRRVFALSERRDTRFRMSGGHAVVLLDSDRQPAAVQAPPCRVEPGSIQRRPFELNGPQASCLPGGSARYGRDILMRGDFENATYGIALDRTWRTHRAGWELAREPGGNHFLSVRPELASRPAIVLTEPFFRRLEGRRYSLVADVRVDHAATIRLSVKYRQAPGEPLTAPWLDSVAVGAVAVAPAPGWQRIRIDFEREADAGAEPRPMRPILELSYSNGRAAGTLPFRLDNIALIEWQDRPTSALPPGEQWFWTHWEPVPTDPTETSEAAGSQN